MKTFSTPNQNKQIKPLFGRSNYLLLALSCALIVLGLILMSGPGSTAQHFEPDIFSTRRIVVAPILCLGGYLLVFVAILWKRE